MENEIRKNGFIYAFYGSVNQKSIGVYNLKYTIETIENKEKNYRLLLFIFYIKNILLYYILFLIYFIILYNRMFIFEICFIGLFRVDRSQICQDHEKMEITATRNRIFHTKSRSEGYLLFWGYLKRLWGRFIYKLHLPNSNTL